MNWIAPDRPEIPENYLIELGISEFVGEVLIRRGYTTIEKARAFLFEEAYTPTPAAELPGLATGIALVESAIREKKKIGVWGDFDVDGQTSTALLVSAFKQIGGDVNYHIPVRATESHGINIPNLRKLVEQGIELLVTCDTGISALEAVDYAKKQGVKVVITDHHDIPESLPDAEAIINPSMLDEGHPLFTLPGVGVAYKFVEQLYIGRGRGEEVAKYLDLVALGIVADVAKIFGDTRNLLQRGLKVLHTTDRLGLKVLMEKAEVGQQTLNEEDIGFSLAPRLNALGRLGDANVIVEFLTSADESRVRVIAEQLEGLNAKRKLLTSQVYQAADDQIFRDPSLDLRSVLVLEGKEWPAGVVGIVASRIAEKYGKPVVLLTTSNDILYRGSARSVEGCDITAAITASADLLEGFGGHPMAAGLSIMSENLEAFKRQLDKAVKFQLKTIEGVPFRQYDKLLSLDEISITLLDDLKVLAPFGHGNPPILFVSKNLRIANKTFIGRTQEHVKLIVEDLQDNQIPAFWWRGAGENIPSGIFNMVFLLKENHFKGNDTLQVEFVNHWVQPELAEEPEREPQIDVIDYRNAEITQVAPYLTKKIELEVWGEAIKLPEYELQTRAQLQLAKELTIVTLPPAQEILQSVLTAVQPRKVFWIGIDPKADELAAFLRRLSGIGKFIEKERGGKTDLAILTGAMGHTAETVVLGLRWLKASSIFQVAIEENGEVFINLPEQQQGKTILGIESALHTNLGEAKAYRKFLKRMNSEKLEEYVRGLIGEYG